MRSHARTAGTITATLILGAIAIPALPAAALDPPPPGKAEGSGEYGLIGDSGLTVPGIYGVALNTDGSIWHTVTEGPERGIVEYRPRPYSPEDGDYLGGGAYADGTGYLGAGWESPVRYTHRDSTAADPAGGTEIWAEPRGIEALPGGGIAVSDTNGTTSTPPGTILFYDSAHEQVLGNAGVGGDEGCTQLAAGELAWGPYFAVLNDVLYAPYQGCNVVSVFSAPDGEPLFRLTGTGQTAGLQPNPPTTDGPGGLAAVYGVSTDGAAIYTSDLGLDRTTQVGLVQRWFPDPETESWRMDTEFGQDGAIAFPGELIYETIPAGDELFVIPQSGPIHRVDRSGAALGDVQVRDVPYTSARDLQVTPEGWLVMTAKGEHSLRILALSPEPLEHLSAEPAAEGGSVELAWDPIPTEYGHAPVLDYVIEIAEAGSDDWRVIDRDPSTATTATLSDLTPGSHQFRVTPYSEAGAGDPQIVEAEVGEPTTPEPPTPPGPSTPPPTDPPTTTTPGPTPPEPAEPRAPITSGTTEPGADGAPGAPLA
ncbi:fibronectin type III domain-containing protein, partial [Leucobacter chromiireducens]|uniref:fibronectin type III domain-containing protein n=1 Tax=Leucobacter chromiireducens TaxID=283877 RepID=UPI0019D1FB86